MCFGDPFYGRDGYYLAYLEEKGRRAQEEKFGDGNPADYGDSS